MKCTILIDQTHAEEVFVYSHQKSAFTNAIKELCESNALEFVGYREKEAVRLDLTAVYCFVVEDNKVYALYESQKLQMKCRLYELQEQLPHYFVKINQSCIANFRKIERFNAAVSGSLNVTFKNGYTDYISRRQLKTVKERLGL